MPSTPHLPRIVCSLLVAGGLVTGGVLTAASPNLSSTYDAQVRGRAAVRAEARPHRHPTGTTAAPSATDHPGTADGHGHVHNDVTTKNAVSRSPEAAAAPAATTGRQAATSRARVAADRRRTEPRLRGVRLRPERQLVPESRYAMAGGCYRLGGQPITFQATGLGSYLLYSIDRQFLAATPSGAGLVAQPSPEADWHVRGAGAGRFTFRLADGRGLRRVSGAFTTGAPQGLRLRRTSGCAAFPEVETNVQGEPFGGVTSLQEVRGWVDPHVHGQTHEFLGGRVICSPPFHPYGAPAALVDCPDHQLADGRGALLEDVLAEKTPGTGHDPVGWPTFSYWPNPHSLTHQQVYYKWLERSWRAGLRLHTSLLTENHVLCAIYPLKKNSCDDRDSVRLQAKRMHEMQDYIDAQSGGPGRGWYRIVTDPFEAREVINEGKLAVVMGMETSVPLGCNVQLGRPTCSEEQMLAELTEMKELGVSQMELTNKFDNAFTGVAGDEGTTGNLTNGANFLSTGSFIRMQTCPATNAPGANDRLQTPNLGDLGESGGGAPTPLPDQDAIFGAIWKLFGDTVQPAPLYPAGPHCNQLGLSPLGERLISAMIDQKILLDPDHMSVAGRNAALDYLEEQQAAGRQVGVVSSHSWSTPDAYPRIYALGGFVAPYAGDSSGFVEKWRQHLAWTDERFYFGFGFGSDMNGFGTQGDPRGVDAPSPVTYPFEGLGGVTVSRQRSGERVFDINRDGVSHYGMYADWVEDVEHVAGADGAALAADLGRGAEAYLQTWERAWGLAPDSCRNPARRLSVRAFTRAADYGIGTRALMRRVGQPWQRLAREFTYCAKRPGKQRVVLTVELSGNGTVMGVRRV